MSIIIFILIPSIILFLFKSTLVNLSKIPGNCSSVFRRKHIDNNCYCHPCLYRVLVITPT